MDKIQKWKYELEASNIIKILKDKYYNALYCPDINSAKEKILEMIPQGASIALPPRARARRSTRLRPTTSR